MKNKLGVCDSKLLDIERKIVNLKLNLLDEYFTFNNENLDFEYIKKLHNFLFSDLYYNEQIDTRELMEEEMNYIENTLKTIIYICNYESNRLDKILRLIQNVWELQPFLNGNTRTFIAYLSILDKAFLLDLNIDVNKNIISNPKTFDIKTFVNQKRLTKIK